MSLFKQKGKSFSLKGIDDGHHKLTYRGVPCIKCPFDYVLYQMIICNLKPDLIIEIGTNYGGSTLYMADLMNLSGTGRVHSIDIADNAHELVRAHERIELFYNGWQQYNQDLAKQYGKIMVIEDASHYYADTLAAMNAFADLVTCGYYLIVEDGIIDDLGLSKQYQGGPLKAITEFLPLHTEFEVDLSLVNFFGESTTFNTKGYLKKSKRQKLDEHL